MMYVLEYLLYHLRPYGINTRITVETSPASPQSNHNSMDSNKSKRSLIANTERLDINETSLSRLSSDQIWQYSQYF